jgi:F420-non-reducing hydrogenase small subunit
VEDVEGYADDYIDVCLFDGAIRNSENEEMARLLRRKSKFLVAYGSCAYEGCIPALSNLTSLAETMRTVYLDNPSLDNPDGIIPGPRTEVAEGVLTLPTLYNTVKSLDQVVDVDYFIPGCPPEPHQVWAVVQALVAALHHGAALPAPGSVIGAGDLAVCDECTLEKGIKKVARFYRPQDLVPAPNVCLLEQGIICSGPATRSGCGALCPTVGMGCRGCYGPVDGVDDQGAKMITTIASILDVGNAGDDEAAVEAKLTELIDQIADPAGTFYRFSMAHSLLRRSRLPAEPEEA